MNRLHTQLKVELKILLTDGDVEDLRSTLTYELGRGDVSRLTSFYQVWEALEIKGTIGPGRYQYLKGRFADIQHVEAIREVENYERKYDKMHESESHNEPDVSNEVADSPSDDPARKSQRYRGILLICGLLSVLALPRMISYAQPYVILLLAAVLNNPKSIVTKDTSAFGTELRDAVKSGSLHNVQEVLDAIPISRGKSVIDASKDKFDVPILLHAADHGYLDIVRYLADRGADMEQRDSDGRSAMYLAAASGQQDVVRYLVEAEGVDVDAPGTGGATPLMMAALFGHRGVASYLVQHGADIHATDDDGWTVLHWAVFYSRGELVQRLLDAGARTEAKNKEGHTALMVAERDGNSALAARIRQWDKKHH